MAIRWDLPVERLDGKPCRVLCTDLPGNYPIAIATEHPVGNWVVRTYSTDGAEWMCGGTSFRNVPQKFRYERWVNVYEGGVGAGVFESRDKAVCASDVAFCKRIATVPVIIEGVAEDTA